jgi:uncharacterized protein YyaL (SSP411 family)
MGGNGRRGTREIAGMTAGCSSVEMSAIPGLPSRRAYNPFHMARARLKPWLSAWGLLGVAIVAASIPGWADTNVGPAEGSETMTSTATTHPKHTNRLIDATSPYLLQHAHNPVDWFPWGDEALNKARAEDKPIFLSIGYAACHWCHVMEHESFEDEAIAAILNEHFVSIKVDREERPDLDEIYMSATLLYNQGQGGWPMSVFLTPDGSPFFAGTYLPPESRYGRPGFKELLLHIAKLWRTDRARLIQGAASLTEAVRRYTTIDGADEVPPAELIGKAAAVYKQAFDRQKGGLLSGQTNKFPPSMAMQVMLRHYKHTADGGTPDRELLALVELTLSQMARGGIYDQIGGGICRYSTDPDWHVPHFEKMLYDQALVSGVYLDAYQLTGNPLYARIAREIFDYVIRDLQSPDGGFYSTRDADSEGQEGKYYVWTLDEIRGALSERDAKLFAAYYDVTAEGNWHEAHGHAPPGPKNILRVLRDEETVANLYDVTVDELDVSLERSRQTLLAVRNRRVPPALDDKVLTAWNGLMIASLARGARVLDEPTYRDAAERAAAFVLTNLTRDGRLLRTSRDGKAHTLGYLDDYAFFIEGLVNLYEATFDPKWLQQAERLTDQTLEHFRDDEHGGFFFTADDAEEVLVRTKDAGDSAVPSGNSVHAMNLLRLAIMLGREEFRVEAERVLRMFGRRMTEQVLGYDRMLAALDFYRSPVKEVAIVGPAAVADTQALVRVVWNRYRPNKAVVQADPNDGAAASQWVSRLPLLEGRPMIDGRAAAYVCENYACRRPVSRPEDLAAAL